MAKATDSAVTALPPGSSCNSCIPVGVQVARFGSGCSPTTRGVGPQALRDRVPTHAVADRLARANGSPRRPGGRM